MLDYHFFKDHWFISAKLWGKARAKSQTKRVKDYVAESLDRSWLPSALPVVSECSTCLEPTHCTGSEIESLKFMQGLRTVMPFLLCLSLEALPTLRYYLVFAPYKWKGHKFRGSASTPSWCAWDGLQPEWSHQPICEWLQFLFTFSFIKKTMPCMVDLRYFVKTKLC